MKVLYSCFVDNKEKYLIEAFAWSEMLNKFLGVPYENIHICFHENVNQNIINYFALKNINITTGKTFDKRSLPLNKLNQSIFKNYSGYDFVVISDTDVSYTSLIEHWFSKSYDIQACMFLSRPHISIFKELYKKANIQLNIVRGMKDPRTSEHKNYRHYRTLTPRNNFCGGTYIINTDKIDLIFKKWHEYAEFCIENITIFDGFERNIDQVSMTMAIDSLNLSARELPLYFNIGPGTKVIEDIDENIPLIGAYHFHTALTKEKKLVAKEETNKKLKNLIDNLNKAMPDEEWNRYIQMINE
jgi:hypothetical protein